MENLIKVRGEAGGFCTEEFLRNLVSKVTSSCSCMINTFLSLPQLLTKELPSGENSASSWKWSSHIHTALRERNQMHESLQKQTNQTRTVLSLIRTHGFCRSHLLDPPAAVLGVHLPALVCSPSAEDAPSVSAVAEGMPWFVRQSYRGNVQWHYQKAPLLWSEIEFSYHCVIKLPLSDSQITICTGLLGDFPMLGVLLWERDTGNQLWNLHLHSCHNGGSSKL